MGRFSRIDVAACLFVVAVLNVGCSKKLTEEEAYSVFEAEFKPKPITCTVRLEHVSAERIYGMGNTGRLASGGDEESYACMKYLAAVGGMDTSMECNRKKCADCPSEICTGYPGGQWDGDSRSVTFECGFWSKAHIESITTRDGSSTVSFSRSTIPNGGDAWKTAPAACKARFDDHDAKGTVRATLDDSGKWRVSP
jgi:hypothetical protein